MLILDFAFALAQLFEQHHDGLQNVGRLEACDDDRLVLILRDPFVGPASDHRRYVAGAEERVE